MPIEFHCDHCGKPVRAPDDSGGKHGQCPSCHQTVYIPLSDAELEPLALAPLDDAFEREKERLLRETRTITSKVLADREGLERAAAAGREAAARGTATGAAHAGGGAIVSSAEMQEIVVQFARAMAEGKLSEAESLAADIRKHPRQAEEVMQRLVVDEMPHPRLAKIPRPVLIGFFKQLREQK